MNRRFRRGFTLIELLIVLAIVGILAAIALANFTNALNRSRQKKTMADIRALAIAWETRATDSGRYNAAGFTFPSNALTPPQLEMILSPTYIRKIPQRDGWTNVFDLGVDQALGTSTSGQIYAIRSRGRDNVAEGSTYTPGGTTRFDCDIVFSNGTFVQYPEGVNVDN